MTYWTLLPAVEAATSPNDHVWWHKKTMRLFSRDLGGPPNTRRSSASILWRHEPGGSVLVQSGVLPVEIPDGAKTLNVRRQEFDPGDVVRFRVGYSAEIRATLKGKRVSRVGAVAESLERMLSRVGGGLSNLEVFGHERRVYRNKHQGLSTVDCFDGFATVNDPAALLVMLDEGVGRMRAYGSGLLTVVG